ncbi:RagB/SusD family nutrient uptake outer membrane protein [Maribellus luteus]|uniref:RagB/SusD family nutrient uptake outer membrane protein n=1 Tax=Maribellus luteus TaxID=2305463 RepID=A0A399T1N5_9BACT|nr:RagB/SusD family nutrient uptake outer membrane protein [Maribellus luteus]RIJ48041.1 RagB/SusD family nutrient uptake outer membrane protein [Maribellus luteus]
MKKIKLIYLLLIITLITSCNDYLDVVPDNVATIDNAFTDRYNAEKYLATCYSYLPNFGGYNNNPTLIAGDELWMPEKYKGVYGALIARGNQSATSPSLDYWRGTNGGKNMYQAIRSCNIFLERITSVPDLRKDELTRWIAEVKFLKAYFHFYLIRMYGPIHITDQSIPVSAETQATKVYRDPVNDCFQYVIDLLDESISDLPLAIQISKTELGRITKPIAVGIKARVMITWASPLFNGNPDYASLVDNKGTQLFPSNYDEERWQKAAEATKEAIEIAHEAGIKLYQPDDVETPYNWSDTTVMKVALRNRVSERWNVEGIWASTTGMVGHELQHHVQPRFFALKENSVRSNMAATFNVVESYYSKNGVPIEEDKNFDFENRYKRKKAEYPDRYFIKQGEETAVINFNREFRYYSDIAFDRSIWFGNGRSENENDPWWMKMRKGEFGAVYDQWDQGLTGYFPKKLVSEQSEFNSDGTQYYAETYPFPVLRLADLYLYYAEALNETLDAPNEEVYQWIDQVRERAGLKGVVESWREHSIDPSKPTTKDGMRKIIQQERMIEFSFEGGRFWDLRRWKRTFEFQNRPVLGWNVFAQEVENYYKLNTVFVQSFTTRDYLWPIAENEIILNPNIIQNVGW